MPQQNQITPSSQTNRHQVVEQANSFHMDTFNQQKKEEEILRFR